MRPPRVPPTPDTVPHSEPYDLPPSPSALSHHNPSGLSHHNPSHHNLGEGGQPTSWWQHRQETYEEEMYSAALAELRAEEEDIRLGRCVRFPPGPYAVFSSWYHAPFELDPQQPCDVLHSVGQGLHVWPTEEHWYQAQRFNYPGGDGHMRRVRNAERVLVAIEMGRDPNGPPARPDLNAFCVEWVDPAGPNGPQCIRLVDAVQCMYGLDECDLDDLEDDALLTAITLLGEEAPEGADTATLVDELEIIRGFGGIAVTYDDVWPTPPARPDDVEGTFPSAYGRARYDAAQSTLTLYGPRNHTQGPTEVCLHLPPAEPGSAERAHLLEQIQQLCCAANVVCNVSDAGIMATSGHDHPLLRVKVCLAYHAARARFRQNDESAYELAGLQSKRRSGVHPRIEFADTTEEGRFWGIGPDHHGQNMRGVVLMMVRDELLQSAHDEWEHPAHVALRQIEAEDRAPWGAPSTLPDELPPGAAAALTLAQLTAHPLLTHHHMDEVRDTAQALLAEREEALSSDVAGHRAAGGSLRYCSFAAYLDTRLVAVLVHTLEIQWQTWLVVLVFTVAAILWIRFVDDGFYAPLQWIAWGYVNLAACGLYTMRLHIRYVLYLDSMLLPAEFAPGRRAGGAGAPGVAAREPRGRALFRRAAHLLVVPAMERAARSAAAARRRGRGIPAGSGRGGSSLSPAQSSAEDGAAELSPRSSDGGMEVGRSAHNAPRRDSKESGASAAEFIAAAPEACGSLDPDPEAPSPWGPDPRTVVCADGSVVRVPRHLYRPASDGLAMQAMCLLTCVHASVTLMGFSGRFHLIYGSAWSLPLNAAAFLPSVVIYMFILPIAVYNYTVLTSVGPSVRLDALRDVEERMAHKVSHREHQVRAARSRRRWREKEQARVSRLLLSAHRDEDVAYSAPEHAVRRASELIHAQHAVRAKPGAAHVRRAAALRPRDGSNEGTPQALPRRAVFGAAQGRQGDGGPAAVVSPPSAPAAPATSPASQLSPQAPQAPPGDNANGNRSVRRAARQGRRDPWATPSSPTAATAFALPRTPNEEIAHVFPMKAPLSALNPALSGSRHGGFGPGGAGAEDFRSLATETAKSELPPTLNMDGPAPF